MEYARTSEESERFYFYNADSAYFLVFSGIDFVTQLLSEGSYQYVRMDDIKI